MTLSTYSVLSSHHVISVWCYMEKPGKQNQICSGRSCQSFWEMQAFDHQSHKETGQRLQKLLDGEGAGLPLHSSQCFRWEQHVRRLRNWQEPCVFGELKKGLCRAFIINGHWILSKTLPAFIEMII